MQILILLIIPFFFIIFIRFIWFITYIFWLYKNNNSLFDIKNISNYIDFLFNEITTWNIFIRFFLRSKISKTNTYIFIVTIFLLLWLYQFVLVIIIFLAIIIWIFKYNVPNFSSSNPLEDFEMSLQDNISNSNNVYFNVDKKRIKWIAKLIWKILWYSILIIIVTDIIIGYIVYSYIINDTERQSIKDSIVRIWFDIRFNTINIPKNNSSFEQLIEENCIWYTNTNICEEAIVYKIKRNVSYHKEIYDYCMKDTNTNKSFCNSNVYYIRKFLIEERYSELSKVFNEFNKNESFDIFRYDENNWDELNISFCSKNSYKICENMYNHNNYNDLPIYKYFSTFKKSYFDKKHINWIISTHWYYWGWNIKLDLKSIKVSDFKRILDTIKKETIKQKIFSEEELQIIMKQSYNNNLNSFENRDIY